jgi:hypothetical protein
MMSNRVDAFLHPDIRRSSWYIIGNPDTGKTTFLKHLLLGDIQRGYGVFFIDLHGDAAPELLGNIPAHRIEDVIYYDITSPYRPAFNLFLLPYAPDKLADDIVRVFRSICESWGVRLDDILSSAIITLLYDVRDNKQVRTLNDLKNFFIDEEFRNHIVATCTRESLRRVWQLEYPDLGKQEIAPVLNKLNKLLRPETILSRIFSTPENELDFLRIMNEHKIVIARLPKGAGEEAAILLGSLFVSCIQQAALARESIPEDDRVPFFLAVDEFQNLASSAFQSILSESRKFKVYLILAHQLLGQISPLLQQHIFSIAKVIISFAVSHDDAKRLVPNMSRRRYRYRFAESNGYQPVETLVGHMEQVLLEQYQHFDEQAETSPPSSPSHAIRADIARALAVLQHDHISIGALKELVQKRYGYRANAKDLYGYDPSIQLFPAVEFRAESYPTAEELVALPRHTAFCKVKVPGENVFQFHTYPLPPPNHATLETILQQTQENFEASQQLPTEQQPPAPEEPAVEPPAAESQPTIDPVQAARERRAHQRKKPTAKNPSASRTPAPETDDDFSF